MFNRDVLERLDIIETRLDHFHDLLHEIAAAVNVHPETLRQLQLKLERSSNELKQAIKENK